MKLKIKTLLGIFSVSGFLYLFLVSVGLMGEAFKGFGQGFAESLLNTTSNPFIGLFIGILATSIVQSSSTTTAIIVGIVGSGAMSIENAIPVVLGANIGTTVTNTLVSLGHIGRREEFRRAITGGTVHDFFNIISVMIFFPLELAFGILHKAAHFMSSAFCNMGGFVFTSPIKLATKPAIGAIDAGVGILKFSEKIHYILLLAIAMFFLFLSLFFVVKLMRQLIAKRAEIVLNNILGQHGVIAIIVAIFFTTIVQSSSITIALMIPLVASGILTVETMFPLIMGANIGTTTTAILASFATGNIAAITVAFVHFLFNTFGVLFIYPIKSLRRIPIRMAKFLGDLAFKKRRYVILYVLTMFFIVPGILIVLSRIIR